MSKLGADPSLSGGCSSGTEETNKAQMGKSHRPDRGIIMDNKTKALAKFLGEPVENLRNNGGNYVQVVDGFEYLVLTENEADELAAAYIADSLWAFSADFIIDTCGLDSGSNVIRSLRQMQNEACEGCNAFIGALVDRTCGIDEFTEQAILADGRGHFLSSYDGEEGEQGEYFIYCIG